MKSFSETSFRKFSCCVGLFWFFLEKIGKLSFLWQHSLRGRESPTNIWIDLTLHFLRFLIFHLFTKRRLVPHRPLKTQFLMGFMNWKKLEVFVVQWSWSLHGSGTKNKKYITLKKWNPLVQPKLGIGNSFRCSDAIDIKFQITAVLGLTNVPSQFYNRSLRIYTFL